MVRMGLYYCYFFKHIHPVLFIVSWTTEIDICFFPLLVVCSRPWHLFQIAIKYYKAQQLTKHVCVCVFAIHDQLVPPTCLKTPFSTKLYHLWISHHANPVLHNNTLCKSQQRKIESNYSVWESGFLISCQLFMRFSAASQWRVAASFRLWQSSLFWAVCFTCLILGQADHYS